MAYLDIDRCTNTTEVQDCASDEEIDEYLKVTVFNVYSITDQLDLNERGSRKPVVQLRKGIYNF
jgi:hypothetical protein